jgi:hypothetical protein
VRSVPDNCLLSTRSSCRARAFPTHTRAGLPNLDREVAGRWAAALQATPTPLEIIAWALVWLSAPSFQSRFDGELKRDYPRLPPPSDGPTWRAGLALGGALLALSVEDHAGDLPERALVGHHRGVAVPRGWGGAIRSAERFVTVQMNSPVDAD